MTTNLTTWAAARPCRSLLTATLLWSLAGCCTQPPTHPGRHELLDATLWSLTAPEFRASAIQAYRAAARSLDAGLDDPRWTATLEQRGDYADLPPAILLDIDQTVLDNSAYDARIVTRYGEYSQQTFSQWCREEAATAVPGARDFLAYARERGVTVIYYSRRLESLRDCTTRNMEALGLPVDPQFLLLNNRRPETKKAYLRTALSSRYRILLLVGDDLEDFVAGSRTDPETRMALAKRYAERWGREWIVLPNPMYGTWDTSLYGYDYDLTREERLDTKLRYLER
jgi:acid phosphatase